MQGSAPDLYRAAPDPEATENFPWFAEIAPQVLSLLDQAEGAEFTSSELSALANKTAISLHLQSDYRTAASLLERALRIDEEVHGPRHKRVAGTATNLATVYGELGQPERAVELYERALAIHAADGNVDPNGAAVIARNLGLAYRQLGQLGRAVECFRTARHLFEYVNGPTDPSVVAVLVSLGNVYSELDQPQQAVELHERAASIAEASYGVAAREVAPALAGLANSYADLGASDRAMALYERVLSIEETVYGAVHPAVAKTLTNIGILLSDQDRYEEALAFQERALGIDERVHGLTHPETAASLMSLGDTFRRWGRFGQALAAYDRAGTIYNAMYGPSHPSFAALLTNTGLCYWHLGEDHRAVDCWESALHVFDSVFGADHSSTLLVRRHLAMAAGGVQSILEQIQSCGDNVPLQVELCQRGLALIPQSEAPQIWGALQGLLGIALLQDERGDYSANVERAIACLTEALAILSLRDDPLQWAELQTHLGRAYLQSSGRQRAANLERADRVFPFEPKGLQPGSNAESLCQALHDIGAAYAQRVEGERVANQEEAIRCFRTALEVRTQEGMPWEWAQTHLNLGAALTQRIRGHRAKNVEEAICCFEAALTVHTLEQRPAEWAEANHNLGAAYLRRDHGDRSRNIEAAIAALEAAASGYLVEAQPVKWAATQRNLGLAWLEHRKGSEPMNRERAIGYFDAALSIHTRQSFPVEWARAQTALAIAYTGHGEGDCQALDITISTSSAALEVFAREALNFEITQCAEVLGRALARSERWDEAATAYTMAMDAGEALYSSSVLLDSRTAELATTAGLHSQLGYALARIARPRDAVTALERGRAREIGEVLARDRAELAELEVVNVDLYNAYRRAADAVRTSEAQERRSIDDVSTPFDTSSTERLHEDALSAQRQLAATIESIRTIPGYERFLLPPVWEEIAREVATRHPLAYVITGEQGSVILVCSRVVGAAANNDAVVVDAVWTDFDAAQLSAILVGPQDGSDACGYLEAQLLGGRDRLIGALDETLPVLGRDLIAPLAAHLKSTEASSVTIVPCGHLGLLPLHAATWGVENNASLLLCSIAVGYIPSARVLGIARAVRDAVVDEPPVLAGVGNPLPSSQPLHYAGAEVREIARYFLGSATHTLLEENATKVALRNAVGPANHVHLSCHGMYNPAEVLASGLKLSDGILTLRDILDESTFAGVRLVGASACQTAITDMSRLPDEVVGLPAGFLMSGAAGVLGTLWSVNDLSTALLMERFYGYYMKGDGVANREGPLTPAVALSRAQRWLANVTAQELEAYFRDHPAFVSPIRACGPTVFRTRKNSVQTVLGPPDRKPFAHPYYWASFVLVGT